jgi:hypothetical protein
VALVRPPVDEGLHAIQQDEVRHVLGVDLGDHQPLIGGPVQLLHVVVRIAGHPLGGEAHRVLERHGEVPTELVGLEAAGLDHPVGLQDRTW